MTVKELLCVSVAKTYEIMTPESTIRTMESFTCGKWMDQRFGSGIAKYFDKEIVRVFATKKDTIRIHVK